MAMLIAILTTLMRILLPILLIFLAWKFLLPLLRRSGQSASKIDVDAEVVSSEPLKVDLDEYEASDVYVKHQPAAPTECSDPAEAAPATESNKKEQ
jgi:hypothetical protein